jgi:hypothetical protein
VNCATDAGTAPLNGGNVGRLQAPLAMANARQAISPPLVVTWYSSSAWRTDATVTPVRTGARDTFAKRVMNWITSPMVMSSARSTGTFLWGDMARNQSGRLSGSMWRNSNAMFFSRQHDGGAQSQEPS